MTIIETDQSTTTHLTALNKGQFSVGYASYIKNEARQANLKSEDYLVANVKTDRALFCLSDGVGSSFYGNLASQVLAETVIHWLGHLETERLLPLQSEVTPDILSDFQEELRLAIDKNKGFATRMINRKDVSEGKNYQVALAMEAQRRDVGTQANFTAGLILPESEEFPEGLLLLFWLGNAILRLFSEAEELTAITGWGQDSRQNSEVWSSRQGTIGTIHAFFGKTKGLSSLIAYSDGLESVEPQIRPGLNASQLFELVKSAQATKDDDITFLEIKLNRLAEPLETDDIVDEVRSYLTENGFKAPGKQNDLVNQIRNEYHSQIRLLQKDLTDQKARTKRTVLLLSILSILLGFIFGFLAGGRANKVKLADPDQPQLRDQARVIKFQRMNPTEIIPTLITTETVPTTTPLLTPDAANPVLLPSFTPTPVEGPLLPLSTDTIPSP